MLECYVLVIMFVCNFHIQEYLSIVILNIQDLKLCMPYLKHPMVHVQHPLGVNTPWGARFNAH